MSTIKKLACTTYSPDITTPSGEDSYPLITPDADKASAVRFDALMYGIELAYLMGKKYAKARTDLFKKASGIASVANIPEIMVQSELINKILHTDYLDNAVIAKLKTNQPLTSADVKVLEEILWGELGTRQDYESQYGSKPLGELVREIVGLDMNAAKEAFAEFLNDTSLVSNQIYFVNQIVEYIVHNGIMKDMSVLQDAPFTDNSSIVEVFTDLTVWLSIKKAIDNINANALAA